LENEYVVCFLTHMHDEPEVTVIYSTLEEAEKEYATSDDAIWLAKILKAKT
jgi:hypothetical protein